MKTEKEKMLAGKLYDANYDVQLLAEREACKIQCFEYNNLHPKEKVRKREILTSILGACGENVIIEPHFWCDYGYNIYLGEHFYANHNLVILDAAMVSFGSNVFIGPNCAFYTAGHPVNVVQRNQGLEYAKPITVGNNVWIGGGVTVLPGVSIGDNVTIGAGSVVTHDIPANVVAVGNPCRILRAIKPD